MTDQPLGETAMDAQIDEVITGASRNEATTGAHPAAREPLDREEQLIRDSVLRMGTLVEGAIREASKALTTHDTALALDVIKGDETRSRLITAGSVLRIGVGVALGLLRLVWPSACNTKNATESSMVKQNPATFLS